MPSALAIVLALLVIGVAGYFIYRHYESKSYKHHKGCGHPAGGIPDDYCENLAQQFLTGQGTTYCESLFGDSCSQCSSLAGASALGGCHGSPSPSPSPAPAPTPFPNPGPYGPFGPFSGPVHY